MRRYPSEDGDRFFFLHRRRLWNPSEGVWMGWERKRGKLAELNRLLRGATDTSFAVVSSPLPADIRYVITLDADTRLLRGTVAQMVGKIAHPLNRARFDARQQRVTGGYGILQPRVSPSLPTGQDGSIYQRLFSSPGGIEPYAAAISDVYQDLFGEGTFTGKGIYDVDAFEAALDGRVPENTLAEPRSVRGHLCARRARLGYRSGRGLSRPLRCRHPPPAPLGPRRLAASALDFRSPAPGPGRRSRDRALEDDRQPAPVASGAGGTAVAFCGLDAAAAAGPDVDGPDGRRCLSLPRLLALPFGFFPDRSRVSP